MKRIFNIVLCLTSVWVFLYAGNFSDANEVSNSGLSEEAATSIYTGIQKSTDFTQRIASSLQKLSKNLILENTRGTKEINAYQKVAPAVVFVLTESGFGSRGLQRTTGKGFQPGPI